MPTVVHPYLMFSGRCEEAVKFYQQAIGAVPGMSMKFSDSPEPPAPGMVPPGYEDKIMHCEFKVGDATIMASDGCEPESVLHGFQLAMGVDTEAEADKVFAALSAGGEVRMPLMKTFWSPKFGMLTDKFGVEWMVSVNYRPE